MHLIINWPKLNDLELNVHGKCPWLELVVKILLLDYLQQERLDYVTGVDDIAKCF